MLWETNGIGDGNPYSQVYTLQMFQNLMGLTNSSTTPNQVKPHGILYEIDNKDNCLQAVSKGTAWTLEVKPGNASIQGVMFHNDATLNVVVPNVGANTAGYIIAKVDWATQTGELTYKQSASGVTTLPTLTRTNGVLWEMPLCSYIVSSAGVFSSIVDTRISARSFERIYTLQGSAVSLLDTGYIPALWNDLLIVGRFTLSTVASLNVRFNGDAGNNYDTTRQNYENTAAAYSGSAAISSMPIFVAAGAFAANRAAYVEIKIPNYKEAFYLPSAYRNLFATVANSHLNTATDGVQNTFGEWRNSAVVSQIEIFPSSGTMTGQLAVYGMGL
jgi:hypothetical protein